jgi:chromosome segregation ATPase
MNRIIQNLNLVGILAIAVLSATQWRDIERLDQTRIAQSAKINEQQTTLKQTTSDLGDTRQRLSISESSLQETKTTLATTTFERDQLKANLQKWTAAVAARDAAIQKLSAERNDAVKKFNDLVTKYNAQ